MTKFKKMFRPLAITIAAMLIAITATGCFTTSRTPPIGTYVLSEITVFNNAGFEIEHWHWQDWDFYDEWGDSFLYFDHDLTD